MSDSIYFQNFDDFLRKLRELEADCEQAAKNVLTRAALEGMGETIKITPVVSGYLRGQWEPQPAKRTLVGWESGFSNNVEYGLYVNYGHRVVRNGKTVGYSTGFFMLEAGEEFAKEHMKQYFDEEIMNIKQGGG